jgi:hypothetical protein
VIFFLKRLPCLQLGFLARSKVEGLWRCLEPGRFPDNQLTMPAHFFCILLQYFWTDKYLVVNLHG